MKIRYAKRALAEIDAILASISSNNPAAAERFDRRIQSLVTRVSQYPEGFQEVAERPGVRRVALVRYPYVFYYRIFRDEITILRFVHGARRNPWEDV